MSLVPQSAVELIAQVLADGQDEHGDRWRTRSVAHHVGKSMGHARRALGHTPIDGDSGHPHLALAAARMVLALAVFLADRDESLDICAGSDHDLPAGQLRPHPL